MGSAPTRSSVEHKIARLALERNHIRDERERLIKLYERKTRTKFRRKAIPDPLDVYKHPKLFPKEEKERTDLEIPVLNEKNVLTLTTSPNKYTSPRFLTFQRIPRAFTIKADKPKKEQYNNESTVYFRAPGVTVKSQENQEKKSRESRKSSKSKEPSLAQEIKKVESESPSEKGWNLFKNDNETSKYFGKRRRRNSGKNGYFKIIWC